MNDQMSKKSIYMDVNSHDKDDGFEFMCMLEKREKFHGDHALEVSCKELLEQATRKSAHGPIRK